MINHHLMTEQSFTDWLARQDPDRTFAFCNHTDCLIASWLKETSVCSTPSMGVTSFTDLKTFKSVTFPQWLHDISIMVRDYLRVHFTVQQVRDAWEKNKQDAREDAMFS